MSEPPLSERDVCTKLITPAVERAGWDIQSQVREEVSLTAGMVMVRGHLVARGKAKRADYVLYLKPNLPLAVIEAKEQQPPCRRWHAAGPGIRRDAGRAVRVFVERRRLPRSATGPARAARSRRTLKLDAVPRPDELWRRYSYLEGLQPEESARIVAQDYYTDATDRAPRYYQLTAINARSRPWQAGKTASCW